MKGRKEDGSGSPFSKVIKQVVMIFTGKLEFRF